MSTQIAVRLPDEMVRFLDEIVATGQAPSRASVVETALAREIRRWVAARDAAILAGKPVDPDLSGLAEYAAQLAIGIE